ncbi:uncharacterized protein LOC113796230 [Dermatophagoides pteronyssinus]|uniref:uncharacterized protein LOC113796230 n=1 Tax=Dermatophagoides pteronyssinus TaxID=6956 RepID=UPI003F666C2C
MNNNLIKVPVSYVHLEDLSILDIFRQDARRHIDIVVECIDSMIAKRNIRGLLDEYSNLRQLKDNLQEWDRRLNRTADDSKQSWLYNQMLNESIDMIVDYFNQSCNDNGNGNGNNIDGHHNHSKISIKPKSTLPSSSTPPSVNNIILSPEPRVESIQKPKPIIMNDKSSLNNSSIVNIDDDDDDKMIKLLPKPSIQSPPIPPPSSSSSANNDNAKRKYREKPEIPKDMDWTKPPPPLNLKETATTTTVTDDSINSSEKCLDVLRNAYNEFRKQTGQPQQPKQQDDNNLADKKLEQLSLNDGQQSNQSSSSSSSIKKQNPMMNNDESMINNLKNHQCLFCERFGHQDHLCNQYNSIDLRIKRAIELNRCSHCFSYLHDQNELTSTGQCRRQVKCLNPDCQNKKHHTNLCFNYLKQSTKQYQNQNQQRNRGKKH